jgi:uncharacterized damage-inducible protein DinB
VAEEFDDDLRRLQKELAESRSAFDRVVDAISDDSLDVARRGGWSVRRVLDHVISSEEGYARVIAHLRGRPIADTVPPSSPASVGDAKSKLAASRGILLGALDGVDEDAFYSLQRVGHEEYSIISVLENVISHDHEHSEQLAGIAQTV